MMLTNLIQIGSLVLVAGVAWRITRGGGGAAVQELTAANRVLEQRMHELGGQVRDLRIENAKLKQRTDFAAVIRKHEEQLMASMRSHEQRAQKRADAQLHVLDLIASRLGPDEEAAA